MAYISVPSHDTPAPTIDTIKKPIIGSVPKVSEEEEIQLWGDFSALRPQQHVEWMRHFASLEFGLARLQAGWIPATPELEWVLQLPQCLFEDMQHVQLLRQRLSEFPTGKKPISPTPVVEKFLKGFAAADHAASFYKALFHVVKRELIAAYQNYLNRCDNILDAPIVYTIKRIIAEKKDQVERNTVLLESHPLKSEDQELSVKYMQFVEKCIENLGGLTLPQDHHVAFPKSPVKNPAGPAPALALADPRLKIISEFPTNKEQDPLQLTLREIIYHNATEWQVVPPMCYVFYKANGMPMDFFADFARHIWDECRHSQMGFRRLNELGYSKDDFSWPFFPTMPESIEEYMSSLTMVGEACSFERKQGSIVPFLRFGDKRSAMLPLVDCVDEKNHVGYGTKWVPELYRVFKKVEQTHQEIALEARQATAKALSLSPEEREKLVQRPPLFCSAIEFTLDFTVY